ncbi:MAG: hypothetical protein CMJ20_12780 [Phycisphaeraceae bacterium]|nr:hypothetical protein [Phycisphaeraceae bacterium]
MLFTLHLHIQDLPGAIYIPQFFESTMPLQQDHHSQDSAHIVIFYKAAYDWPDTIETLLLSGRYCA